MLKEIIHHSEVARINSVIQICDQEFQESLIQERFIINKIRTNTQIFSASKLSGVHPFDNMAIINSVKIG